MGRIDIAGIQSLARLDDEALGEFLGAYDHVVVDECHHAGAASHVRVLEATRARYVTGLSATPELPERRDELGPIVQMLCGPIRHRAAAPTGSAAAPPLELAVETVFWDVVPEVPDDAPVQTLLSAVAGDEDRTAMIAARAVETWRAGRKVLVLSERRGHVDALVAAIGRVPDGPVPVPIVLHGQLARAARRWRPSRRSPRTRRDVWWRRGGWSARGSITRRWTRSCSRCRSPGAARSRSTWAGSPARRRVRRTLA